ncbi:unnamed protein product, partial [Vitis vinifera]
MYFVGLLHTQLDRCREWIEECFCLLGLRSSFPLCVGMKIFSRVCLFFMQ